MLFVCFFLRLLKKRISSEFRTNTVKILHLINRPLSNRIFISLNVTRSKITSRRKQKRASVKQVQFLYYRYLLPDHALESNTLCLSEQKVDRDSFYCMYRTRQKPFKIKIYLAFCQTCKNINLICKCCLLSEPARQYHGCNRK